tara:strand:+ start:177 stop:407 length:231 start_codon:yes stop_codon:yes gene_type:complete
MDNNFIKHEVIADMEHLLECVWAKCAVLDALDRDTTSSGSYDLVDQLTTIRKYIEELRQALDRAGRVVPYKEEIKC